MKFSGLITSCFNWVKNKLKAVVDHFTKNDPSIVELIFVFSLCLFSHATIHLINPMGLLLVGLTLLHVVTAILSLLIILNFAKNIPLFDGKPKSL